MRVIVAVVVAAAGVAIGLVAGWEWVVAVALGVGMWTVLSATLRSMVSHAPAGEGSADPEPVPRGHRSVYWCQECGTELLLIVRGSDSPPRHCGLPMEQRSGVSTNGG